MKYYGNIGFAVSEEKMVDGQHTGVWEQHITVKPYRGELSKPVNKWQNGSGENQDASFSSQLSIVSDPFAIENFHSIKYAEFLGVKWKVTSVEIMRPRLLLTLGGEYVNG
ncbi:MAG: hypothetical protein J6Y02_05650 [Pseudobutyrivibrio sp.]|nr:hypothetical protein [Pseudobutyrivibrio sp.]